jgi:hypothetical protein
MGQSLIGHWAIAGVMGGLATLVSPTRVMGQSAVIFEVANYTSQTLFEFYATPTDDENWGDDLLDDELPPVSAQQITLDSLPSDCLYDVLAVFGDGEDDVVEEYGVNLCALENGSYAFYDENDRVFSIENQTSVGIIGFYFTPTTTDDWGNNLFELPDSDYYVLQPGDVVEVPIDSSECSYNFKAVFAADTETIDETPEMWDWTVFAWDVCSEPVVVIEEE